MIKNPFEIQIRRAAPADADAVWRIIEPTIHPTHGYVDAVVMFQAL